MVARACVDGSGPKRSPCALAAAVMSSRIAPGSTVAVRASGSTDEHPVQVPREVEHDARPDRVARRRRAGAAAGERRRRASRATASAAATSSACRGNTTTLRDDPVVATRPRSTRRGGASRSSTSVTPAKRSGAPPVRRSRDPLSRTAARSEPAGLDDPAEELPGARLARVRRRPASGGPCSSTRPPSRKQTWSATSRAKAISCVASSIVMPSFFSSRIRREHLADELGVERAGDLVEEHQPRLGDQRARDRDALLLSAGQFVRTRLGLVARARPVRASPSPRPRPARACILCTRRGAERDVVDHAQVREQVERLEHDADLGAHLVRVRRAGR